MKKTIYLLLLIFAIGYSIKVSAQGDDEPPGRVWKALDGQTRIMLIEGIEQGIALCTMEEQKKDKTAYQKLEDNYYSLTIKGFRMSDIAKQVDSFYSDSANIRIPIFRAYQYSIMKMKGATNNELDAFVVNLRRTYNN
ncbi:MAG TPA: hypothetical protein VGC66_24275 [Pyrinomonadaceae bacterium]|jgi:hypothetical protein